MISVYNGKIEMSFNTEKDIKELILPNVDAKKITVRNNKFIIDFKLNKK